MAQPLQSPGTVRKRHNESQNGFHEPHVKQLRKQIDFFKGHKRGNAFCTLKKLNMSKLGSIYSTF